MECLVCGKLIKSTGRYFCSTECYHQYRIGRPIRDRVGAPRYCQVCGKPLLSYKLQKYCSRDCYHKSPTKGKPPTKPRKPCLFCGNPIEGRGAKFCSVSCSAKYQVGKQRPSAWKRYINTCQYCGKKFEVGGKGGRHKDAKFCSRECQFNSCKKSGGYRAWYRLSKAVIERDKCCVICGNGARRLQAHHVTPKGYDKWSEFEGVETIDDLVAVCPGCHQSVEALTKAGYRNNPDFNPWDLINMVRLKT